MSRLDARRVQGGGLYARIDRVACSTGCRQVKLIEGVNRHELVARRDPIGEGLHRDVDFLVRGCLGEAVCCEVLVEGGRGTTEGDGLNIGGVAQPGRRLVALGGRHIPEREGTDRNDDRQGNQNDCREGAPQAMARIA